MTRLQFSDIYLITGYAACYKWRLLKTHSFFEVWSANSHVADEQQRRKGFWLLLEWARVFEKGARYAARQIIV